jgi:hypothetical protein
LSQLSHDVCGDPNSHPPSPGSVKPAPWRRPAPPATNPLRRTPAPPGSAGLGAAAQCSSICHRFHSDGSINYFNRNSSPGRNRTIVRIENLLFGSLSRAMRCIVRAMWTSFSLQSIIKPSWNTIIEEITSLQEACQVHDRRKW